jgi:hypothetical protein
MNVWNMAWKMPPHTSTTQLNTSENRPIWGSLRVWRGFRSGFPAFSH